MGVPLRKYELVARAIKEAGSTDTGKVSLKIEQILHEEMLHGKCYAGMSARKQFGEICRRLERYQIYTSNDIRDLITEVQCKKAV
jgi:hypothetical protein